MEPDPLSAPLPVAHNKKTKPHHENKGKFVPANDTFKNSSSSSSSAYFGLNLVVCVLCTVCVIASVYNGWRDSLLNNRLAILEDRVAYLEVRSVDNVDVLVDRLRREAVQHLQRRVSRDLTAKRFVVGDDDDTGRHRYVRDAPECVCPAGMCVQQ